MALLPPGVPKTYQLAPGETLSIVTDSVSQCRYGQLIPPSPAGAVGEQPSGSPVSVPASSAIVIGPRSDISRWLLDGIVGPGVVVVQNSAASVPDSGAPADVCHLFGAGAPTGATGQNQAATGSLFTDFSAGKLYVNSGSKATPSWRLVTSA
jgi:hypothetical protein